MDLKGKRQFACVTLMFFLAVCAAPITVSADEKPPEIIPLEKLPEETPEAAALRKAIDAEVDAYRAESLK